MNARQHSGEERRPAGLLEDQVLAALWANAGQPMTPARVQAELGGLAYTTVMTTLSRLYRKGLAERQRAGRGYAYTPAVDEATHTARAMGELLRRRSDRAAVLARFVSELDAGEERLLGDLLRESEEET